MSELPYIRVQVITVTQAIGTFYIASIPVRKLLSVCFSARLKAESIKDGYVLRGNQRQIISERLTEIAEFINTPESAFPNSIILSANDFSSIEEDESIENIEDKYQSWRWKIDTDENGIKYLEVPNDEKLASVIDGQHRLFAYSKATDERKDDELCCSIFFDLPKPVQAYLFATINSKQKPVDKSQTYELFGYNTDDEPANRWDAEKLAVFIARKLNIDEKSPLKQKILIAATNDIVESRSEAKIKGQWMISMATIVQGVSRSMSSNPSREAIKLKSNPEWTRFDLPATRTEPALQEYYRRGEDGFIYKVIINFLVAVNETLWTNATKESKIIRTIGVQAIFDLFRDLALVGRSQKNMKVEFFKDKLLRASRIDFSDDYFETSGRGRGRILKVLRIATGILNIDSANIGNDDDKAAIDRILENVSE